MNHSPHKKFIQRKEIREIQENKLHELLAYLKSNSPYYQRIFKQKQIDIHRIQKLEDLELLPTTVKEDLQSFNE